MFSNWINGILRSFDGYSAHNTDFLALVKVLLTYIWRWLAKCSSSSFYSACGDRGLKQIRKFFSNKCHIYSLVDVNYYKLRNISVSYLILSYLTLPKWRKEQGLFWKGQGRVIQGEITPNNTWFFMKLKTFLLLWDLNNPTPSFAVFWNPLQLSAVSIIDKFCG